MPRQGFDGFSNDTDTGTLPVRSSATITGTVLDPTASPIADAHVVSAPHGFEATTDADGRFELSRLPVGETDLVAAAEGFEATTLTGLSLADGDTATVALNLGETPIQDGLVTVAVLDPAGNPLSGAVLTASSGESATAGDDGTATLSGAAGTTVDLVISDPDDALWPSTLTDIAVPQTGNLQLSTVLAGRPASDSFAIGSKYCSGCHSDISTAWSQTAHGQALSTELTGELADAFAAGVDIDLGGPSATLWMSGATPSVTLSSANDQSRTYDIAGIIGDARSASVPYIEIGAQAWPLPLAWVGTDTDRDDWPEGDARFEAWETDRWFTSSGAFSFAAAATPDPTAAAETQCFGCHATGYTLSPRDDGGVDMLATYSGSDRWNDAAVGCESCHGPASDHAAGSIPNKPYSITVPTMLDRARAQDVCARCHSATRSDTLDLAYAYDADFGAFHPGQDLAAFGTRDPLFWADGTAAGPAEQSDELTKSVHGSAGAVDLLCVDCHDPHGEATDSAGDPIPAMTRLDWRDNSLCSTCHLGLSFGDDESALEAHPVHYAYDPDGPSEMGRCTGCHMPKTAATVAFGTLSGAGDLSSHMFIASAPQVSIDAFDAEGVDSLAVGSFPIHACAECHAYRSWREDIEGTVFGGPTGDPSQRATHDAFQAAYELKFP